MDTTTIEAELTHRLAHIVQRIDALEVDLRKEHSQDFAEQVTERENDEILEALLVEARNDKRELSAALRRLQDGAYGLCVACGKPIDERRLAARVEAGTCIDCAV